MTLKKRMKEKIRRFKTTGYTFLLVPFVVIVVILTTGAASFCLLLPGIVCTVIGIDSLMSAHSLKKKWCKELFLDEKCSESKPKKNNWYLDYFQDENPERSKWIISYFKCFF